MALVIESRISKHKTRQVTVTMMVLYHFIWFCCIVHGGWVADEHGTTSETIAFNQLILMWTLKFWPGKSSSTACMYVWPWQQSFLSPIFKRYPTIFKFQSHNRVVMKWINRTCHNALPPATICSSKMSSDWLKRPPPDMLWGVKNESLSEVPRNWNRVRMSRVIARNQMAVLWFDLCKTTACRATEYNCIKAFG